MITIIPDPQNPDRVCLLQTTAIYLDRLAADVLGEEVSQAVREQARKDLQSNKAVKKEIHAAATRLLLGMLGVATGVEPPAEEPQTYTSMQAQAEWKANG